MSMLFFPSETSCIVDVGPLSDAAEVDQVAGVS